MPELSRLALAQLIATLPPYQLSDSGSIIEHLQIANLPSARQVVSLSTDDWVIQYEHLRETVERKQRTKGSAQTGVFYTPRWIATYLAKQSLGCYLDAILNEMKHLDITGNVDKIGAMLKQVQALRILDPACGTGIFLVEALQLLGAFYQQVACLKSAPRVNNPLAHVLCNQIYGIDIDPLSVMITELRLAQWAARLERGAEQHGFPEVKINVICADTLAGPGFPEVRHWDFILGNPPYVSETRRQSQRFRGLQSHSQSYYQAKMDLCDAFVAWSIEHLIGQGQLAFVLPEYWTQRSSSQALRRQLWQRGQLLQFWRFTGESVFKNAPGHHPSLIIWQKQLSAQANKAYVVQLGTVNNSASLTPECLQEATFLFDEGSGKLLYGNPVEINLLQKLAALPPLLLKQEIQQGIVIPQGKLKKADAQRLYQHLQKAIPEQAGVFILNKSEISKLRLTELEKQVLRPYYGPAKFRPFQGFLNAEPADFIIYGDRHYRKLMEQEPENYSNLRAHLDCYRAINTSAFAPYGLHRPRQPEWFEDQNKMLCPRQVMLPSFAVVPFPAYFNEGFYSIRTTRENVYYLCGILNSKLAWFWFYHHKRKGHRLQIDKDVLSTFPKPPGQNNDLYSQIQSLAGQLSQTMEKGFWEQLNRAVYQLYQLTPEEADYIEGAYRAIVSE